MRLLKFGSHGELSLTNDLIEDIPRYAILSHTWGADDDEVTFNNLKDGSGQSKAGYEKIQFCGEQARKDGLQYFWVDTCCINKSNNAELSEAIISMFRWYRNAAKCYVYLSDVTTDGRAQSESSPQPWELAFRKSRWFTRGWTLQELLAPHLVDFFCSNGHRLGDKDSLEEKLHEITGIPILALQGGALSGFDVDERLLWAQPRETKREEDKAYSLLGIFNVNMPVLYGEGQESAFRRLRQEISALEDNARDERSIIVRWLAPLPYNHFHKKIERASNTCRWIFETAHWKDWHTSDGSATLWLYGEPGVGKTALASAVIDTIDYSLGHDDALAYFYCNASNNDECMASTVIASLVQQLLIAWSQHIPVLLKKKYLQAQKTGYGTERPQLKDSREMLETLHKNYKRVFYVIDGLDECSPAERKTILDTMLPLQQTKPQKTKLMLSSRKTQDVFVRMSSFSQIYVSVEANSADILGFVSEEIDTAVRQSRLLNGRISTELQAEIVNRLAEDARGMFLWAKLQIPVLCDANTENRVRAVLANYPKELEKQYERMVVAIQSQENDRTSLAFDMLRWITFALRPLKLDELWTVLLANGDHKSFERGDLDPSLATDICQNFLHFDTSLKQLSLLHTSARQYLERWFGNATGHGYLATQCARYLTDCGFDQEVEGALERYIEPNEVPEPPHGPPSPDHAEEFRKLWDVVQRMDVRSGTFTSLRDTYCFLEYAGSFWLRHADKGIEHFALTYFPWILDAKSGIFATWRNLNGIEGGLVLHALGDLTLIRLEKQLTENEEPGIVHIAAHLGLKNLLFHVLERMPEVKHKQDALVAAATEGIDDVVRTLLLDKRVVAPPGAFRAVMCASTTSHTSTVTSLLAAAKKYSDDGAFDDSAIIATIGACLSPKEEMITAVTRTCGDLHSSLLGYDMVKTVASLSEHHRDGISSKLVEDMDVLNTLVMEVFGLQGWSTLMITALHGNEKVVPLILGETLEPNLKSLECALTIATLLGHRNFTQSLLDLTPVPLRRQFALSLAVQMNGEELVDILIQGISPLRLALLPAQGRVKTIMGEVAASGHVALLKKLVSKGFKCAIQDDGGKTPLHRAVEGNQVEMVKNLLGILEAEDVSVEDADGERALDIAVRRGLDDITALLDSVSSGYLFASPPKKRRLGDATGFGFP